MMKRTIIAAAAIVALAGCNTDNLSDAGYGYIDLGVNADSEIVVTKGISGTDGTDFSAYNVTLRNVQTGADVWTGEFSAVAADAEKWKVQAGTYSVYVENLTDAEAHPASGAGEVRVAGNSGNIVIAAGEKKTAGVHCTPVNSKVSFVYTPSFAAAFDEASATVSVALSGRACSLKMASVAEDAETFNMESEAAYFPAAQTLTWTLSAAPNSGSAKTYTGTFTTEADKWTFIRFSGGDKGELTITVTVDNKIDTQVVVPEVIDPLK